MAYEEVNGVNLNIEIKGEGIPILFIHGLGSSALDWEEQIRFFSARFKTIAIDLRGHGLSESSKCKYSISLFAKDICEVLKLKIDEPIHIVGISMGAMVAFQIAVDNFGLVKTLTIINSVAEVSLSDKATRKALRIRKIIPRILGMKRMGKVLGKKLFPKENQARLRKLIAVRWAKNNTKDYIKSTNAMAGWTVANKLNQITCPVLVVHSENDYTTLDTKQTYTNLMPNAYLVEIPDAGHAVTVEKPEAVNNIIGLPI